MTLNRYVRFTRPTTQPTNFSNHQAFGTHEEILNQYLIRGIINWGAPVTHILEDGNLLAQQAKATDGSGKLLCCYDILHEIKVMLLKLYSKIILFPY